MLLAALLALTCTAQAGVDEDLLTAVVNGDVPGLAAAISQGADIEARGDHEATALMLAAERGHTAVMRSLLEAGADANAARPDGVTPLMHAAAGGHAAAVQLLLEASARVNTHGRSDGISALRVAVAVGSIESARRLLAAGADRNDEDSSGARLLFTAAGAGSVDLIDLFLTPGEDIDHKRREGGYTALDAALERQHWAAAEHLLAHGAHLQKSVAGREQALLRLLELEPVVQPGKANPLVQVVEMPSTALFRAMLDQGASTTFIDEKGNDLLMLAAKRHHVTGLQALLAAGLDVNARNAEGDTALAIAAGKTEYELMVVGLGLALGQDRKSLLRLVFRPAQKSNESASTARRLDAAKLLLAAKADPNTSDVDGNTPLMEATRSGDAELVQLLIASGAAVDMANASGARPLTMAAQFGLHEIATDLILAHADPSVRDAEGRSPLDLAREGGHERVIGLLEQALD